LGKYTFSPDYKDLRKKCVLQLISKYHNYYHRIMLLLEREQNYVFYLIFY